MSKAPRIWLGLSWLALFLERAGAAFWPFLSLLGLVLAVAISGLSAILPLLLHFAVLGMSLLGLLMAAFWGVQRFQWPSLRAAFRRLDRDSGAHRNLSASQDEPAFDRGDALTRALWQRHQDEARQRLGHIRLSPPGPRVAKRDPWGLRFVSAFMLLGALIISRGAVVGPLQAFLAPNAFGSGELVTVKLWLTPPEYTGVTPKVFDSTGFENISDEIISVPEGTTVLALVHGLSSPSVLKGGDAETPLTEMDGRSWRAEAELRSDGVLTLESAGRVLFGRPLTVQPDEDPHVEMISPPESTSRGRINLVIEARDDHGVTEVGLSIRPLSGLRHGESALILSLSQPWESPDAIQVNGSVDLTEHQWAGKPVVITPWAADALGQRGEGSPVTMILPTRTFRHPVAQELARIRARITEGPETYSEMISRLDNVSSRTTEFRNDLTVFLAIRSVRAHLARNGRYADLGDMRTTLWKTALRVEDGETAQTNASLDRLRDKLTEALSRDMSQAEMDQLMAEIQQTLSRAAVEFSRRMAEMDPDGSVREALARLSQQETAENLDALLDDLQEMSRLGAKDASRALLERLQAALSKLDADPLTPEQAEMLSAMNALSNDLEKMRKIQADLLDETFQVDQIRNGADDRPGGGNLRELETLREGDFLWIPPRDTGLPLELRVPPPSNTKRAQQPANTEAVDLAIRQDELARRLEKLLADLAERADGLPPSLNEAAVAMDDAASLLEGGDLSMAMIKQRKAIEKLSEGEGEAMAQMQANLGLSLGLSLGGNCQGPNCQGPGVDPLGRASGDGTENDSVRVPDQVGVERARQILDELRRRANDPNRSVPERDYIERLIPRF